MKLVIKLVEFILAWFCLGEIIENLYYRFSGQFHFFVFYYFFYFHLLGTTFIFGFPIRVGRTRTLTERFDADPKSSLTIFYSRPSYQDFDLTRISSLPVFTPAMWTAGPSPSPYDIIQYRAVTYSLYDIVF